MEVYPLPPALRCKHHFGCLVFSTSEFTATQGLDETEVHKEVTACLGGASNQMNNVFFIS